MNFLTSIDRLYQSGIHQHQAGHLTEAEGIYRRVLAQRPGHPGALHLLGVLAAQGGKNDLAVALIEKAIALAPGFPAFHSNLGEAYRALGRLDEAAAACRQALELKPDYPEAFNNLGNALKDAGDVEAALAAFRQAIVLKPGYAEAHSNLLYTLHFHPGCSTEGIHREHLEWEKAHAHPLRTLIRSHPNERTPGRRLKIGYVSPDFQDHCQSLFTVPLLSHHARRDFEIVCYSSVRRPDALTARLQGYADSWRNVAGLTDEQLAALVRQDQIDILVDLTMHMARNRLLLFARRPAPVQVCWLAYPGTTGLSAIDYRLSDPYLDPPGPSDAFYSEKTIRLPQSFWCYDPLDGRDLPVDELPAQASRVVTFGCLNNFCKINDVVLRLWAKVLNAVPSSRLLLLAPEGRPREQTLELLEREDIDSQRIEFASRRPRQKYLELYRRIDLGLDSFPYNGHTTSLDSFWMGVPVVTLVGQTAPGRAGLCHLTHLGLDDLISHTPEQFVQVASDLARDLPRLAHLRATLRARMEQSPLMDAPQFARDVETAYRELWRNWCTGSTPEGN